jgi:hypothetical protein
MGMSEDPETYLRRFAEGQLRRLAGGEASAADCASRVDAVAAAFEGTGLLDRERAEAVAADLAVAFAARSPERDTPLHAGRRAQVSALRGETGLASMFARNPLFARNASPPGEAGPSGEAVVVPVGAVLRLREDGRDEDVYLLSYVTVAGKAWLNVAVDGSRRQTPAPGGRTNVGLAGIGGGIPVGGHGARQRMTATDNAGRPYRLGFSGGGSQALSLGQLSLQPVPPPGIAWLEVHCAGESVRIDLTATAPGAEVTVRSVAGNIGEAYLLRRAEILLTRPSRIAAAEVTGLASAVPALRAVGALPGDSPVPGQVAALAERMGAPGRAIAAPAELPERWADIAAARSAPAAAGGIGEAGGIGGTVAAAWLSAVLPEADGLAIYLAGLATLPGNGTLIFGGLQVRTGNDQPGDSRPEDSQPGAGQPAFSPGQAALWVRDDAGGWHSVAIRGWSRHGSSYTFRAAVEPPIGPGVSSVGFYVAGATTEIRAVIPLTWWTA